MAINAVLPTIPVANDVIMGEFKAYYDLGLPTQTLIGATNEGCTIDIDRVIEVIKFDGAYGPTLDSNGDPLVRYKGLVGKITLNSLYLKYFNRKIIADMESDTNLENNNWGGDGGTYTAETTIKNSGDQAAKVSIATTQTGHGVHEVFDSPKDLSVFDNSESSVAGDSIGVAIHITTAMKAILGTDSIRLIFHMDSEGTEDNLYYYDIESTALTADVYTPLKILKSAFTETGTGNWANVVGWSIEVPDTTDDALSFYVDSLSLIQTQNDSSIVPVNSGFSYTNETTYKSYVPSLEIPDTDYFQNIGIVGQRMDGKKIKIIMEDCLNDGAVNLAFEGMEEIVNETVFTSHYKRNQGNTFPVSIYEYVA